MSGNVSPPWDVGALPLVARPFILALASLSRPNTSQVAITHQHDANQNTHLFLPPPPAK